MGDFMSYFGKKEYTLKTLKSDKDIDFLDDSWHTIIDLTASGKPVYFWAEFYNGNFEIRITMDGTVAYLMDDKEMVNYDLAVANLVKFKGNAPYKQSSDIFSWYFPDIYFATSFVVDVRRRSGNNHGLDRMMFIYKEEID